ncbi:anthranilate N-benzoyltransferase protein 2-like [Amaranthus tricolor]|uniref:anthranilate N-benzoyltransferase protein 2-like n=1 Tax=Amaranthus tricolor TaxID=29722 RepID=UPI00258FC38D|nr:anthranilate N-benzoyltransferase protein 2-like [Amaranthus tricolor]
MVIPTCDYSKGLSSFPLFMVQFTRFKCGGVCMGIATHHHVNDGSACAYFVNSWTRIARGLELLVLPVHERSAIPQFSTYEPTQVKFRHLEYEPSIPPTFSLGKMCTSMESSFTLSKSLINALKQEATPKQVEISNLSTFEIVAAHVWRTTCKVRGLAPHQDAKLYIPIDGRPRLKNPNPPKGYYGNLIFFAACIAKSRDITCNPLWYAATKIKEAIQRTKDEEYLKSALNFLETFPKDDPMVVLSGPESITSPNLMINSWAKLPFCETDFGWGNPIFGGTGGVRYEGLSFLTQNMDGGFSLNINLFKDDMSLFEKCLYDFKIVSSM